MSAYKRPAADSSGKWLTEDYFETNWQNLSSPALSLPVALDLKTLYEQMLAVYIGIPPRPGENLESLVERVRSIRKCQRELHLLTSKMSREKQFNWIA